MDTGTGLIGGLGAEGNSEAALRDRILRLQHLVAELLIRNQELRESLAAARQEFSRDSGSLSGR